jgi:hypothetical protein
MIGKKDIFSSKLASGPSTIDNIWKAIKAYPKERWQ